MKRVSSRFRERLQRIVEALTWGPESESSIRLRNELEATLSRIDHSEFEVYTFDLLEPAPKWITGSVIWVEKGDIYQIFVLTRELGRWRKDGLVLFQLPDGTIFTCQRQLHSGWRWVDNLMPYLEANSFQVKSTTHDPT